MTYRPTNQSDEMKQTARHGQTRSQGSKHFQLSNILLLIHKYIYTSTAVCRYFFWKKVYTENERYGGSDAHAPIVVVKPFLLIFSIRSSDMAVMLGAYRSQEHLYSLKQYNYVLCGKQDTSVIDIDFDVQLEVKWLVVSSLSYHVSCKKSLLQYVWS